MVRSYVAWFVSGDWDEIKRLCANDLQDTFDEWLASTEAGIAGAAAQGVLVEKVLVTPDLRQRQLSTGRKVNANGRMRLAVAKGVEADNRKTRH
jgi:hypothetical protein